jgi:hypothetical protein
VSDVREVLSLALEPRDVAPAAYAA